jgi:hypothetical protein
MSSEPPRYSPWESLTSCYVLVTIRLLSGISWTFLIMYCISATYSNTPLTPTASVVPFCFGAWTNYLTINKYDERCRLITYNTYMRDVYMYKCFFKEIIFMGTMWLWVRKQCQKVLGAGFFGIESRQQKARSCMLNSHKAEIPLLAGLYLASIFCIFAPYCDTGDIRNDLANIQHITSSCSQKLATVRDSRTGIINNYN